MNDLTIFPADIAEMSVSQLAALPAALLGGIGYLLGRWVGGTAVAMLAAAVGACAVFAFELACALRLLGRRIERFDLSQELR